MRIESGCTCVFAGFVTLLSVDILDASDEDAFVPFGAATDDPTTAIDWFPQPAAITAAARTIPANRSLRVFRSVPPLWVQASARDGNRCSPKRDVK